MMTALRYLQRRRGDYQSTFIGTKAGERVLADLHSFCGADKQSFVSDPYQTANNEGRRRVWLHVAKCLSITDEQMARITSVEEVNV